MKWGDLPANLHSQRRVGKQDMVEMLAQVARSASGWVVTSAQGVKPIGGGIRQSSGCAQQLRVYRQLQ